MQQYTTAKLDLGSQKVFEVDQHANQHYRKQDWVLCVLTRDIKLLQAVCTNTSL